MCVARPKVVVFDLGKVLVDFDFGIADVNLARYCKCSPAEVHRVLHHGDLLYRYELGQIDTEGFYHDFQRQTGFSGGLDEFGWAFGAIFSPLDAMIEFERELRQRAVPTYIFSNTNELAIHCVQSQFAFFGGFRGYIYSYEQKAMKPQPRMYEVLEEWSGGRAGEILYFDDRPENVAAGVARGWHGIIHESAEKSIAAARALGL